LVLSHGELVAAELSKKRLSKRIKSLSGVMIAGQKERPEEQDPRITVGSVTFCTVDGVIWGRVRDIGCGGGRGSP
jgi:hypothetical protein